MQPEVIHDTRKGMDDSAMLGNSAYARNERDFYPTIDKEVTNALARFLKEQNYLGPFATVWECAAGDWSMGSVLDTHFTCFGSDLVPNHPDVFEADFLRSTPKRPFNAIVTNPPFGDLITSFMDRGVEHIRRGNCTVVAMLGRNELDSSGKDRKHLFGGCPEYAAKLVLTWRPKWIADSKGSPRHNYAWFIWSTAAEVKRRNGPQIFYASRR